MNIKNNAIIEQFVSIYANLNSGNVDELDKVYHSSIEFIDPIHHLSGLPEVKKYMHHMYENITDYQLTVLDCVQGESTAYLTWTLQFRHPKLNGGKKIEFEGVSKLDFNEKIYKHQDFYDLGAMLYEHIPMFGSLVKIIKTKAGT
jgi:hypothetical protein